MHLFIYLFIYGAFVDRGPLAEDSAAKLKKEPAKCVYRVCVL
jgi:hypothetical protein